MASPHNAEQKKKSLARFFTKIQKSLARFFLKIMNFHLCIRLTRVKNESGVDLLWVPFRRDSPMDEDHWGEIPRGHFMDVHFGDYTTHNPDVDILVHLYPKIDNAFPLIENRQPIVYPNGVEGRQVRYVLTSGLIREHSTINLYVDNQNTVHPGNNVPRPNLPKGFSWCSSVPLNEARIVAAADQPELENDA
ncbi:hypothetical protein RJ641_020094 [Dillenia turbinata]|uniref:Uncharacterized protein n=1 Tax=Dillenia turbinata TaxID=194707 RepID=A0AAN8UQV4_9MAGN